MLAHGKLIWRLPLSLDFARDDKRGMTSAG